MVRPAFILFASFCLYGSLWSQTFKCDGRLILGTNNQDFTNIHTIGFAPFFVISYNPIATFNDNGFDALGFNPRDNYIYATHQNTNNIVRLRSDGTFETLGAVDLVDQLEVYAGDCTPDGRYLCHDNQLDQILVFNVVNQFDLIERINLFWDPSSVNSGPFTTRIDDFVIDPINPTVAYSFQPIGNFDPDLLPLSTAGYFLRINLDLNDPNVGMVTPLEPINANIDITRIGSLFFTGDGGLYGYGSQESGPNAVERRLISINPQTGQTNATGIGGPSAPFSDGCSCPYNLNIYYVVEPPVATCTDSEVTYSLTIRNRSYEPLSEVTLTDTVPEGMLIQSVEGNFTGDIDPTTGVGTRFLTINGLQIPPFGTVQMTIDAQIIDIPIGNLGSQVHLKNLPSLFDEERVSDDPYTPNINDPAIFAADAIFLEDVELEITQPTDCLINNDGKVIVSGPQFMPGIAYKVGLFNQDWDAFMRDVIVDNNNSFVLDSMPAGNYHLDLVQPEGVQCSYEWKDTTINIEPPHDQLEAIVETNSPICEGMDLVMNAVLSPGGEVEWRGAPVIMNVLSVLWENVDTTFSGEYKMTANYGACEQVRLFDVIVEPAINASIAGETDYCERDSMQLLSEAVGDSLIFEWSGPNNLSNTDSIFEIASMTPENGGTYEVIVDNFACQDTAAVDISILPSPTIEMQRFLESDFCDPVSLNPVITGDNQVSYTWTPAESLSCADCPNPEIQFPMASAYQLQVVNDTLCTDSATIFVYFNPEDLVYIPNAFSPNFDGINDYFQLFPSCKVLNIKTLEVYDRWGNIVYSGSSLHPNAPDEFWDGRINGEPAAIGTYLWRTEIELINGRFIGMSGDVNLLR